MDEESSIVISGISCRFPQSDNMGEFKNNLFNGVDMVTTDKQRFDTDFYKVPRFGQLRDLSKFDAAFFGIPPSQANTMDPGLRMLLEVTFEAIVDAGVDPTCLRGSKTGVYVGSAFSEAHSTWSANIDEVTGYEMTGCELTMFANKLSHYYDFTGPSYVVNSACSSTLLALHEAFRNLQSGQCEQAIVGGSKLILNPSLSKQFEKLGMLSPEGRCASFDEHANGYCRSEGIAAIFLQKRKNAKRVYCTIVNTMTNNDGYTEEGITFPSKEAQVRLLKDVYREANVDANDVSYVEAHGTGTQAGDIQEISALSEVMCSNRKRPLLIGSVKSNMGHCEHLSGLSAIAKLVVAMENKMIPMNLNYNTSNPEIVALHNGQIEVVRENTSWNGGYIGINGAGFGGTNVHVILHGASSVERKKIDDSNVDARKTLHLVRGRTFEMTENMLNASENNQNSQDFQEIVTGCTNHEKFSVRGYSLGKGSQREIKELFNTDRPLWFVFSGMGSQWQGMGQEMMAIPQFCNSIMKSDKVLRKHGVSLIDMMSPSLENSVSCITNAFTGIVAIQIAFVDTLKAFGITPSAMVGHSIGELACAFTDNCLTREQTLEVAVIRGRCIENANLPKGAMVATGLTWEDAQTMCPEGVVPACHNAKDSVTISGRQKEVREFLKVLQANDIFAKEVNSDGVAFHSEMLKCVKAEFEELVEQVIVKPSQISKSWITTSVPPNERHLPHSKLCSAKYLVNNLLNPVLFHDALQKIPSDAVVIEIAPVSLLQPILKRSLIKEQLVFGLMKIQDNGSVEHFLKAIGGLWMTGVNLDVTALNPLATLPVAQYTPMISSLVSWDHTVSWAVPAAEDFLGSGADSSFHYNIDTSDLGEYGYLRQHIIDGRAVFPATGYLVLAWRAFATSLKKSADKVPVTFQNVQIHRTILLLDNEPTACLSVYLHYNTPDQKRFGIIDKDGLVVTGLIGEHVDIPHVMETLEPKHESELFVVQKQDVYLELKLRGYGYGPRFQGIASMSLTGQFSTLEWMNNWITFLDLFLQIPILAVGERGLKVPTRIGTVMINPTKLENVSSKDIVAFCDKHRNSVSIEGVFVDRVEYNMILRRQDERTVHLASYRFQPYIQDDQENTKNAEDCLGNIVYTNNNAMMEEVIRDIVDVVAENTNDSLRTLFVEESRSLDVFNRFLDTCFCKERSVFMTQREDSSLEYENGKDVINWMFGKPFPNTVKPFDLVILDEVLFKQENVTNAIEQLLEIVTKWGFIVVREPLRSVSGKNTPLLSTRDQLKKLCKQYPLTNIAKKLDGHSHVVFVFRKIDAKVADGTHHFMLNADDKEFDWLNELQERLKYFENTPHRIWLITEDTTSGLVGFVNCLRREPGGDNIRCILNLDKDTMIEKETLVKACLSADLVMNVFFKGTWGSFRDSRVEEKLIDRYSFVDIGHPGNMSTLKWSSSPLQLTPKKSEVLVSTHLASLNFRDVMIATGRLPMDAIPCGINDTEGKIGMEFSGMSTTGNRVMGMCDAQGIATSICAKSEWVYHIPAHWSFEDAATVPIAYCTAYYALIIRGGMERGDSVLIHSGTGSLGQAAITVALHYDCEVFVTVGNDEKKAFLLERFPAIKPEHIFNSRSTQFEIQIRNSTKGKGVDFVLNSLSGEKLEAGIRCLAEDGIFLEVGRHDILNNTSVGMGMFYDNSSLMGVHLDSLYKRGGNQVTRLRRLMQDGLDEGVIQPLNATIFPREDVEKAFRYMSNGKHIGKILVQIRHDDSTLLPVQGLIPRLTFSPNKSYIITGGLGGLGLEIAEWMVVRGAKHVVLVSRSGVRNGFQKRKIQYLTSKGASVSISRRNICDPEDSKLLVSEVKGCVGGIFHFAGVLQDKLFESMCADDFRISCDPKITAAKNLDMATRLLQTPLDYFVVSSSLTASKGTPGQTNYGYANSAMERLCEQRKRDGLPGLAIQFGLIGDVGMASHSYDQNSVVAGTSPLSIAACLSSLDVLLSQADPVVSMCVKAKMTEKKHKRSFSETVFRLMGVGESKLPDDATLADLGLDSLSVLEVKQLLERKTDRITTTQAVKTMTVQEIKRLD